MDGATVLVATGAAVASSALTLGIGGVMGRLALRRWTEHASEAVARRLREELEAVVDDASVRLRGEVARGLGEGAEDVLPRVRAAVREGVEEALRQALRGGLLKGPGGRVARTGASAIGRSLDLLLGAEEEGEDG